MRRRLLRGCVGVFVVMIAGFCVLSVVLVRAINDFSREDESRPADVIVVLGAGSRRVIERRTAHAIELWQDGIADHFICTGGDTGRSELAESEFCQNTLRRAGVPDESIFIETVSRSTEENAIEAEKIMQANGWQSAVVVSDNYHLWRARLIFSGEFPDGWTVYTSPAQVTQAPVPERVWDRVVMREVAAIYWYVGKETLGLRMTDFPG